MGEDGYSEMCIRFLEFCDEVNMKDQKPDKNDKYNKDVCLKY